MWEKKKDFPPKTTSYKYMILTFVYVLRPGLIPSLFLDGVIVANVGYGWRGPADHPPLGALLTDGERPREKRRGGKRTSCFLPVDTDVAKMASPGAVVAAGSGSPTFLFLWPERKL